ncbi:ABC transporter ATP-binding protein [Paenibacillus nicotianae]|uniref:ABC transporter ATP-binding protein n=1 Tax=Paenibacillus nicotianae TaxID=1526551 RepID=A0ABW4US39_9BACL
MIQSIHPSTIAAAIEGKQLCLDNGHFRLNQIDIALPKGQLTAIVGPNGSGKSTLLRLLTRLLKPDQGQVHIGDREITDYSLRELSTTITMLTQMKDMLPQLTVYELVAYGRSPYKRSWHTSANATDTAMIDQVMHWTGIEQYRDRMFHTLSGGEQQRTRIAMALAQQTDILLLDEPTTFLDIAHQFEVMDMLKRINMQSGLTIVMVLHDLQQAVAYCDYMIALKQGQVATSGIPQQILTTEFIQDIYHMQAQIKFEGGYPVILPVIPHHQSGGHLT